VTLILVITTESWVSLPIKTIIGLSIRPQFHIVIIIKFRDLAASSGSTVVKTLTYCMVCLGSNSDFDRLDFGICYSVSKNINHLNIWLFHFNKLTSISCLQLFHQCRLGL